MSVASCSRSQGQVRTRVDAVKRAGRGPATDLNAEVRETFDRSKTDQLPSRQSVSLRSVRPSCAARVTRCSAPGNTGARRPIAGCTRSRTTAARRSSATDGVCNTATASPRRRFTRNPRLRQRFSAIPRQRPGRGVRVWRPTPLRLPSSKKCAPGYRQFARSPRVERPTVYQASISRSKTRTSTCSIPERQATGTRRWLCHGS